MKNSIQIEKSFSRKQKSYLLSVTILALILRLYQLGAESLWYDESLSVFFASQPFNVMIQSMLEEGLQHSPLYYVFLRPFLEFGFHEFNVRLLSVIFGFASIPLIAILARIYLGCRTALLTATIMAINPYHIWYSQETRMYTMLGMATIAVMYYFSLAVFESPKFRYWSAFTLLLGLGYNIHHWIFFIPLVQLIFFLLTFKHNYHLIRYWGVSVISAGILLIPWMLVVLNWGKFYGASGASGVANPRVDLFDLFETLANFSLGNTNRFNFIVIIVISVFILIIINGARDFSQQSLLLVIWLIAPPLITLVLSTRIPMYMDRYLMISFPAFLILLSKGLSNFSPPPQLARIGTSVIVFVSMLWGTYQVFTNNDLYERADWKAVGKYLETKEENRKVEIYTLYWQNLVTLHFYYHGESEIHPLVIDQTAKLPQPLSNQEETWIILPYQNDTSHKYGHCEPFDDTVFHREVIAWRQKNSNNLIEIVTFECIQIEEYIWSIP